MPFFSKTYSLTDYTNDVTVLQTLLSGSGEECYDSDDSASLQKCFEIYDRVYKNFVCSSFHPLFSEKELDFHPFDSNLTNFTKTTSKDLASLTPCTKNFLEKKKKELLKLLEILGCLKDDSSENSSFADQLRELLESITAVQAALKKEKTEL